MGRLNNISGKEAVKAFSKAGWQSIWASRQSFIEERLRFEESAFAEIKRDIARKNRQA